MTEAMMYKRRAVRVVERYPLSGAVKIVYLRDGVAEVVDESLLYRVSEPGEFVPRPFEQQDELLS